MKSKLIVKLLLALFFVSNVTIVKSQLTIMSGVEGGSYQQMANDINNFTNNSFKILISKGNVYSFEQLMKSKVDVAFLQSDVMFVQNTEAEDEDIKNIKVLLPLGQEEIHLVTKKSNNINSLNDLEGKYVGIGSKYQGTNITARFIKILTKVKWVNVELSFEESFEALASGKIDAFFFVGSVPVAKFNDVDSKLSDEIKLVPLKDSKLDGYYPKATIKAGTYTWLKENVETFAVKYVLATNITNQTPDDLNNLNKLLVDIKTNIKKLQEKGHSVWKQVDFKFDGINWEIHDVAKTLFNIK